MLGKEPLSKEQRAAARQLLHLQVIPRRLLHKIAFQKHPIDFVHLLSVAKIYQHFIADHVKNTWQLSALLGNYDGLMTRFPGSTEQNNDGTFQDRIKTRRDRNDWTIFNFAAMSGSQDLLSKLSHHYRYFSMDPEQQLNYAMILLIGSMRNDREWSNALADFVEGKGFECKNMDLVVDERTHFCIDHFSALAGNLSYFIPTHYSFVEVEQHKIKRKTEDLAQTFLTEGNVETAESFFSISQKTTVRNEQPQDIFQYSSNFDGVLPIHCAAAAGQVSLLFKILQNDPQMLLKKDHAGCTLLHHAAKNGQYITFDYLYPLYAEHLYVKDNKGFTPYDHLILNMKIRSPDPAQKTGVKVKEIPTNYALTLRQIHLLRMMKYKYQIDHTRSPVWNNASESTKHAIENLTVLKKYHANFDHHNEEYYKGFYSTSGLQVDKFIAVIQSYIKRDRLHNELAEHICEELKDYFQDASYSEFIQYFDQVIDDVIVANATRLGGSYDGSLMNRLHFIIDTLSGLEIQSRQQLSTAQLSLSKSQHVLRPEPGISKQSRSNTSLFDQFKTLK